MSTHPLFAVRLGRMWREVWADCQKPSGSTEGGEDGGDFGGEESAPGEHGQGGRSGVIEKKALELLPGRTWSDGRKILLRQLHATVGSNCCFHTAKILKNGQTAKYFGLISIHKWH